jgi:hypothetical protein
LQFFHTIGFRVLFSMIIKNSQATVIATKEAIKAGIKVVNLSEPGSMDTFSNSKTGL